MAVTQSKHLRVQDQNSSQSQFSPSSTTVIENNERFPLPSLTHSERVRGNAATKPASKRPGPARAVRDSVQRNTGAGCANPTGVMFNVLTAQIAIANCKRWTCEPCGKRKAKQLFHRLKGYRFERMITLTGPANTKATRANCKSFNYAWKLFKQQLRRIYGGKFDYLFGNESGERTGQLHKHIALPWFYFDYKARRAAMKKIAKKAKLGVVCDFGKKKPIKHKGGAVSYCLSYVVKDRGELPKYARRIQTNVRKPKEEKQPGWIFLPKWDAEKLWQHPWYDSTTAEIFAIAKDYLDSELALIEEHKLHADLSERADAGQEAVK